MKSDDIDGYLEFTGTVLGELTKEDLKSKRTSSISTGKDKFREERSHDDA